MTASHDFESPRYHFPSASNTRPLRGARSRHQAGQPCDHSGRPPEHDSEGAITQVCPHRCSDTNRARRRRFCAYANDAINGLDLSGHLPPVSSVNTAPAHSITRARNGGPSAAIGARASLRPPHRHHHVVGALWRSLVSARACLARMVEGFLSRIFATSSRRNPSQ